MSYFSQHFVLTPENNDCLLLLCGRHNEHLKFIAKTLNVDIKNRAYAFTISGHQKTTQKAKAILVTLYDRLIAANDKKPISHHEIFLMLQGDDIKPDIQTTSSLYTKYGNVNAYNHHQRQYIKRIQTHHLNFGIGPAGTGKTFLAVACAVDALKKDQIQRIILVRPAVEAGEKLGFLPGDMVQKVDPYLRPLYDALFELLDIEYVDKLLARNIIEIAPLAYMRGRTLNDAFIILDESQNTTIEQMKMFLTRVGFGSTTVVTGDITQIDLPNHQRSGLVDVIDVLRGIKDISFTFFDAKDAVRHPIVQTVIEAYERHKDRTPRRPLAPAPTPSPHTS